MKTTDAEYFALPQISNSDLGLIDTSYDDFLHKSEREETAALKFGRAFHSFILENDDFFKNNIIAADLSWATKEGKLDKERCVQSGLNIVRAEEWSELGRMKDNLANHPLANKMLTSSSNEGVYFGVIEGVEVRCKIDLINKGIVADLKSCDDASFEGFRKSMAKWNYHRQAAFYSEIARQNGIDVKGFSFIAVEKGCIRNGVAVYEIGQVSLDQGMTDIKRIIEKYKAHKANPEMYKGYSEKAEVMDLPGWKLINNLL